MTFPTRLETRLDRLWQEWLDARAKAQESQDITDGVAAGRAWSRWLAEFEPADSNHSSVREASL
jgi:hypothetical protein